jgi:hypothetical protein
LAYCLKPLPAAAHIGTPSAGMMAGPPFGYPYGGGFPGAPPGRQGFYSGQAAPLAAAGGGRSHLKMVLARVTLGRQCDGQAGMRRPPPGFDSVRGGAAAHVVFDNAQALPEYIITMTAS